VRPLSACKKQIYLLGCPKLPVWCI
jgi:hypothetical protein